MVLDRGFQMTYYAYLSSRGCKIPRGQIWTKLKVEKGTWHAPKVLISKVKLCTKYLSKLCKGGSSCELYTICRSDRFSRFQTVSELFIKDYAGLWRYIVDRRTCLYVWIFQFFSVQFSRFYQKKKYLYIAHIFFDFSFPYRLGGRDF